jgi:3-deoxy-manno-octulosonate cytidylyltransferase (CMP-KDO synthetase)
MNATDFNIVIPARYASSRFPGKPLAVLMGQPMIWHVYQRALEAGAKEVVVATDDERIAKAAKAFGAEVCMTDINCESGTDRIAEVAAGRAWADDCVIVNLQGDEPLTSPALLQQVAKNLQQHPQAGIATLCSPIESLDDFHNPNVVKVVFDNNGYALYFSRAAIPWPRDDSDKASLNAFRHIGLYAYRKSFLSSWSGLEASTLEQLEKLEQLRAMQSGVKIHVDVANCTSSHGVDTPEQLDALIKIMKAQ